MYCNICGDSTINKGENNHLHNPVKHLADEAFLPILSFLSTKAVSACSRVSREWKRLSEDQTLWSPLETLLKITAPLKEGESPRSRVSQKVAGLQGCVQEVDPLLSREVKTARDFDIEHFEISFQYKMSTLSQEDYQKSLDKLACEAFDKVAVQEKLQKGLAAHVLLRRVGLSAYDNLEKYASCLSEKYGQENGWSVVVVERVREDEFDTAETICNTHLSARERGRNLEIIIRKLCVDKRLDEAFALYKRNRCEEGKIEKYWEEDAINNLIGLATSLKRYDLIETIIDEIDLDSLPGVSRLHAIIQLLEEEDLSGDMRLFRKYQQDLLTIPAEDYALHFVIPILIKFGDIAGAWELALSNRDNDKLVLYVLRNEFETAELFEEMERVKEMIARDPLFK